MDQLNISNEMAQSLSNLSPRDQQELSKFVQAESQKAQIQSTIHGLTDICFRKCVTSRISAGTLDRNEDTCMRNCVDRFMDSNMAVIRKLEQMRAGSG